MNTNRVEIKLNIDEGILISMREPKQRFEKLLLFYTSLSLYKKGRLGLGKAAELAGYSRLDFIRKIQEEGDFVFDYDDDLVDEMIRNADHQFLASIGEM